MNKIIKPFFTLANANLSALSRVLLPPDQAPPNLASMLWRSSLESQAQFIRDYTQGVLGILAESRSMTCGHIDKISARTERVASQLTHTAVRAVAIATHARREKRDRRIFPLPLPAERRGETRMDRRKAHPSVEHHAVI